MPAPQKYSSYVGDISAPSAADDGEDRQFNVVTMVFLSFFVGCVWGGAAAAAWYHFNP